MWTSGLLTTINCLNYLKWDRKNEELCFTHLTKAFNCQCSWSSTQNVFCLADCSHRFLGETLSVPNLVLFYFQTAVLAGRGQQPLSLLSILPVAAAPSRGFARGAAPGQGHAGFSELGWGILPTPGTQVPCIAAGTAMSSSATSSY